MEKKTFQILFGLVLILVFILRALYPNYSDYKSLSYERIINEINNEKLKLSDLNLNFYEENKIGFLIFLSKIMPLDFFAKYVNSFLFVILFLLISFITHPFFKSQSFFLLSFFLLLFTPAFFKLGLAQINFTLIYLILFFLILYSIIHLKNTFYFMFGLILYFILSIISIESILLLISILFFILIRFLSNFKYKKEQVEFFLLILLISLWSLRKFLFSNDLKFDFLILKDFELTIFFIYVFIFTLISIISNLFNSRLITYNLLISVFFASLICLPFFPGSIVLTLISGLMIFVYAIKNSFSKKTKIAPIVARINVVFVIIFILINIVSLTLFLINHKNINPNLELPLIEQGLYYSQEPSTFLFYTKDIKDQIRFNNEYQNLDPSDNNFLRFMYENNIKTIFDIKDRNRHVNQSLNIPKVCYFEMDYNNFIFYYLKCLED